MKRIIQILTISSLLYSCNLGTKQAESDKQQINKKLLGFKTSFIAELGSDKYQQLEKELAKEKLEIKYVNDIIYVSYLEELNACGQYKGNVEIDNDTIKLMVNLISEEVCTSLSMEKVTFLIDNPKKEKKIIMKK